jgi:hypothetical protein
VLGPRAAGVRNQRVRPVSPVAAVALPAGGRPQAALRAGLEDVEKLLTSIISRSGTARRFGGRRRLLGQD